MGIHSFHLNCHQDNVCKAGRHAEQVTPRVPEGQEEVSNLTNTRYLQSLERIGITQHSGGLKATRRLGISPGSVSWTSVAEALQEAGIEASFSANKKASSLRRRGLRRRVLRRWNDQPSGGISPYAVRTDGIRRYVFSILRTITDPTLRIAYTSKASWQMMRPCSARVWDMGSTPTQTPNMRCSFSKPLWRTARDLAVRS